MKTSDLLERLVVEYADAPAPTPSRALASRMDEGWIGTADDEGPAAVVVPFAPRPRLRMRYLVAATLATLVATSGLAVAGALPDDLQRRVASVVAHVGIDLPTPQEQPSPAPGDGRSHDEGSGSSQTSTPAPSPGGPAVISTPPEGGTTAGGTSTPSGPLSGIGGATTPPAAPDPPSSHAPSLTVPPVSLPPVTLPPVTLPAITLPAITLPAITLPR